MSDPIDTRSKDPRYGLPINPDGSLDLSNGIPTSDADRSAYEKSLDDLVIATAALPEALHPLAYAIHEARAALPLIGFIPGNPISPALADKLAQTLEEVAQALKL